MPLADDFDQAASNAIETPQPTDATGKKRAKRKRKPPFGLRLSDGELSSLKRDAAGIPLGTYIKSKALGTPPPTRRSGLPIIDRREHARALALLGQSHLASNLNQIAHAVNIGVLPMTPETEAEVLAAIHDVRQVRRLLMKALGMRPEDAA